jgi:lysophospholipase L1-like esterase
MKVYVIGDSISMQYGPWLEQYLRGVAAYGRKEGDEAALQDLDNPQGANGGDSSMVLDFLRAKAGRGGLTMDLLLVNCGLHDIKTDPETGARQVPLDQYKANLAAIVNLVAEAGPQLIWIRTTPCDEAIHNPRQPAFQRFAADCDAYNAAADAVMHAAGVPTIDLHTFTINLGPDVFCDHVHFHESVRAQQAAFIAGWLRCYLASRDLQPTTERPARRASERPA